VNKNQLIQINRISSLKNLNNNRTNNPISNRNKHRSLKLKINQPLNLKIIKVDPKLSPKINKVELKSNHINNSNKNQDNLQLLKAEISKKTSIRVNQINRIKIKISNSINRKIRRKRTKRISKQTNDQLI